MAPPVAAGQPAPTASWILVDADTGAVIDALNPHQPLPPASVIKLLTALIAVTDLPRNSSVPVSARTESMPAMRIGMRQGQTWPLDDALHSLLMVSANDAAVALAERVGGSLAGFSTAMTQAAGELGLTDRPSLHDPAGLDDSQAYRGGNLISARDLAVVARAALTKPAIRTIAGTQEYRFTGPDGRPHHLRNHNKLLARYPGAIGLKTGYTRRARHTFVAAATRDGRTMLAVILASDDMYGQAASLLDKGFATPVKAERGMERLPNASLVPHPPARRPGTVRPAPAKPITKAVPISNRRSAKLPLSALALFVTPLAAATGLRMSARRRRRRATAWMRDRPPARGAQGKRRATTSARPRKA